MGAVSPGAVALRSMSWAVCHILSEHFSLGLCQTSGKRSQNLISRDSRTTTLVLKSCRCAAAVQAAGDWQLDFMVSAL